MLATADVQLQQRANVFVAQMLAVLDPQSGEFGKDKGVEDLVVGLRQQIQTLRHLGGVDPVPVRCRVQAPKRQTEAEVTLDEARAGMGYSFIQQGADLARIIATKMQIEGLPGQGFAERHWKGQSSSFGHGGRAEAERFVGTSLQPMEVAQHADRGNAPIIPELRPHRLTRLQGVAGQRPLEARSRRRKLTQVVISDAHHPVRHRAQSAVRQSGSSFLHLARQGACVLVVGRPDPVRPKHNQTRQLLRDVSQRRGGLEGAPPIVERFLGESVGECLRTGQRGLDRQSPLRTQNRRADHAEDACHPEAAFHQQTGLQPKGR